jgi:hypothetical protein
VTKKPCLTKLKKNWARPLRHLPRAFHETVG